MLIAINRRNVFFIILLIPTVKNQFNLYNTDQNQNSFLYFDCLQYFIQLKFDFLSESKEFSLPFQTISYCIRPVANEIDNDQSINEIFTSYTFDQLIQMNITIEDLLKWSISFDMMENYQEYLNTLDPILSTHVLNNCSNRWFGSYCQYRINQNSVQYFVSHVFNGKERQIADQLLSTHRVCYTLLKCNRCLDWREIYDGKIDCTIDGIDEENCLSLEMNECNENEYRCHNGLCIPKDFLDDYSFSPDCLDGADEYIPNQMSNTLSTYPGCYRDPSFRCEESHHPLRLKSFPCGDGETLFTFASCANGRHFLEFEILYSFDQNNALSFNCWLLLYCATAFDRQFDQCKTICKSYECSYNLSEQCHSTYIFFPQTAILHNHIRFAYATNETIRRKRYQRALLPHFVCYEFQRCPFLIPTLFINGLPCQRTLELNIKQYYEIDQYFRACINEYKTKKSTLIQCSNTGKFISKYRLLDGIIDCYNATDENGIDGCSLNDPYRFVCSSEKKCISRVAKYDSVPDCFKDEDERRYKKIRFSFQELCNGFTHMNREIIDNQTETDETNCDEWPCDNLYTRCDKAWSCLNGADESKCTALQCSPTDDTIPCISPYNFTEFCLPISRANDGIIDCLGSSDERSYCRSKYEGQLLNPYRCWNDSKCIQAEVICLKGFCPFEDLSNQCKENHLDYLILSMKKDYHRSQFPYEKFFFLEDQNISLRSFEQKFPIEEIVSDSYLIQFDHWKCNRGIPVEMNNTYRCFCPPSYYGNQCQFQSQRVSLTLQIRKICAPSCHGVFQLLLTLFDNKQMIHSQEQLTYHTTTDCKRKLNSYLLYNQRAKDLKKNYSIRIDVYNKISISYYASWFYSIPFQFLPVNRIAMLLIIPATPMIYSKCSKSCIHGHCSLSTCLCPLNETGPRCLLPSICQKVSCPDKNEICIPLDRPDNRYICYCWARFPGDYCEKTFRMEVSFSKLAIPQIFLAHIIEAKSDSEISSKTTSIRIRQDQDEGMIIIQKYLFNLLFIQIHDQYYLAMKSNRQLLSGTKLILDPSYHCPHIRELLDTRLIPYPLLRRAKFYHRICRQRLDLHCFHDQEELLCLCTKERHANCLNFDFNLTYNCDGLSDCQNNAKCFQDSDLCPNWILCECSECFYGSKCQFTTKGFGLSLDAILGYSIRPHLSLHRQFNIIKITLMIIISTAKQRASAQKQRSYRQHLREQWRHHNHLIFSSIILVILAIPRLIISFLTGCMKSPPFPDEQEVIIMPGTFLKIESEPLNFIDLLLVVHLKEESIIHQNHENVNLNLSSSTNSLLNDFSIDNMNIDDRSRLLLSENVRNMRSFSTLSKCSMIISIIFTILLPGTTFAFLIKTLFFSSSYTHSSDPFQVYTTSTRSTTTDLLDGVISTTCSHRQFHIEANILYSFDCSSFTDEIEGKYNGILTQDFWITYSEKLKGVVYISPDYSGKGSAIKFNSNTSQSIQLTRSPNLFNQSFTISFWINPNIENSSIYGLFNQIYVTAPSFNISIIEEYIVTNIYGSSLWSTKKLEKNRWQYLSLIFNKKNLSMSIYIDGIFNTESLLGHHSYGNFEITKTTCGSLNTMNTFHGLIDQLSILFEVKNPIDILNEATLVFHYNFQDNNNDNDFLFKDSSVNSIHAQGSYVSHLIDKSNHYSLSLYNSMLSYFQTENFLSTFDYSYSLWIHISNQSSSIISVLHLVTKSSSKNSTKKCLNHLIFNQTGDNKLQLSMYIYELNETIILKSNISIDYSTWFHFVFISGMNNFSLYINGNLVNLLNRTNLFKINNQQRFTLTIGNPQHQLSNNYLCYFNQTFITSQQTVIGIDDLRFYSRQLKYQEIQALYKNDLDPTKFFFD
ncbi:hypothetical protein I4U23_005015 [Adineta vaga]|nr:hypothetical protein I4U23_005015 [Adineta vaga]